MRIVGLLFLLFCLSAFSVMLLADGKKYSLKTEWRKGDSFRVSIEEDLTYAYAGADEETAQRTLEMQIEVLQAERSRVSMKVKIIHVKRENIDTKKLPEGPSKRLFSLLGERGVTVVLSDDGEVKELKGLAELCREAVPGDGEEAKMSREMLKLQWEEPIKSFMRLFGFVTSDRREASVGDKWTRRLKSTAMITLDSEIEYSISLKEVKKQDDEQVAVVSYSVVSLKSEFLQVKESKGSGTLIFSLTKKRLREFSLKQEFVVDGDRETHSIDIKISESK